MGRVIQEACGSAEWEGVYCTEGLVSLQILTTEAIQKNKTKMSKGEKDKLEFCSLIMAMYCKYIIDNILQRPIGKNYNFGGIGLDFERLQ